MMSVSWGDHLLFGEGHGRLASPEDVDRRMECWRDELNASIILWREERTTMQGHFYAARGHHPFPEKQITWDDFQAVTEICHKKGVKAYLYVTLFDEGKPLPREAIREFSYQNHMDYKNVSWQSRFSRKHPEYAIVNRTGDIRQWGVLCLAYLEVRSHFLQRYLRLLSGYDFDGLFVCLRSQSKPAAFADQFGFNEPIREDYLKRYERDIWKEDFDLQKWRDMLGEYLTRFLESVRNELKKMGIRLAIGIARGDVIGPPLGNWTLQWREWIKEDLIDDLVINQSSTQCPSIWHQLWPMHHGYGYLQNYHDNYNMPELKEQLDSVYAPVILEHNSVNLFVACQWYERNLMEEEVLLENPAVKGLVFSSFRFDNPKVTKRDNHMF